MFENLYISRLVPFPTAEIIPIMCPDGRDNHHLCNCAIPFIAPFLSSRLNDLPRKTIIGSQTHVANKREARLRLIVAMRFSPWGPSQQGSTRVQI